MGFGDHEHTAASIPASGKGKVDQDGVYVSSWPLQQILECRIRSGGSCGLDDDSAAAQGSVCYKRTIVATELDAETDAGNWFGGWAAWSIHGPSMPPPAALRNPVDTLGRIGYE